MDHGIVQYEPSIYLNIKIYKQRDNINIKRMIQVLLLMLLKLFFCTMFERVIFRAY